MKKPLSIAIFGPNLCKKGSPYAIGHTQNEKKPFFFVEITRADYQLSRDIYFIKKSYILAEL